MLLSINTCGTRGSVALGRIDASSGAVEIVAQAELAPRTYSAQLIPKIAGMLAAQGVAIHDLAAIVVVRGPGSFTGIRVGLSAAKGLAEASGTRLIAISRLELLASGRDHALAAVDAGRGEYYVGEYKQGETVRESLCTAAELGAAVRKSDAGVLVCEASAEKSSGKGAGEFSLGRAELARVPAPDAADALRFAAARFRHGMFDDVELLDANYLRRSDAEIFSHAPDHAQNQAAPGAQHRPPKP